MTTPGHVIVAAPGHDRGAACSIRSMLAPSSLPARSGSVRAPRRRPARPSPGSLATLAALALVGGIDAAAADDAADDLPLSFATLGPDGLASRATIQLAMEVSDGRNPDVIRFDLGGQYTRSGRTAVYAAAAVAVFADVEAVSDLEVGGLARRWWRGVDTALRVGLVLPTASGGDAEAFVGSLATVRLRPSDTATWTSATWLRLAIAPLARSGRVVLRADVGVDVAVVGDPPARVLVHVDTAAGVELGGAAVTAELQLASTGGGLGAVLAGSVQGRGGGLTPYVTASVPFGPAADATVAGYNLAAGLRIGL